MTETLFHAYTPLILWTGLGLLVFRFIPNNFPRLLGRSLYWVGVPLQILALARRTTFSGNIGVIPAIAVASLVLGFTLAWISLQVWKHWASSRSNQPFRLHNRASQGSFILAAMVGNTGFVGLAIAPFLISDSSMSWAVFYSVIHNLLAPYGVGVWVASYFGHPLEKNHWWIQVRDVLTVPSLWAFGLGYLTQPVILPDFIESGLQASVSVVIACGFVLIGLRLGQLQGWKSFQVALVPAILKALVMPGMVGIGTTLVGLSGELRLTVVLMSGVPSALMGLILAEEYDLDRELIASSIVLTTVMLLFAIPLWLFLLGH